MVDTIALEQVIVPSHQRELREWKIQHILEKIRERGYYNFSYPITIDEGNELVDGGHRLEAAKRAGLKEIPFIRKPQGIPSAQHAINCNQDGADTEPYDVFDYAYYCWMLAQQGWTGQMIAGELGEDWSRTKVQDYKAIKLRLCSDAWICARGVERKTEVSTSGRRSISTLSVEISTQWNASHFRSLFKYLACDIDNPDEITAGEQVRAIEDILAGFADSDTKVTAEWVEGVAQKHAWRAKLKRLAQDGITPNTNQGTFKSLLDKVDEGQFDKVDENQPGDVETVSEFERFKRVLNAITRKMPSLYVGRAENMHFLEDESVDLIITSPPYNLDKKHWPMGGQGRTPREHGIGYDEHDDARPEDEYQAWQLKCLQEMYRVAKPGASLFYNHKVRVKDGQAIHPMEWVGDEDNPWMLRQELVWDMRSTHNHCPVLFWPHDERIYWMTKGNPELPEAPIGLPSVIRLDGEHTATPEHPAPFPYELPRVFMQAVGRDGIVVLDPFAGRCTTVKVALEEFGYDAIGVDISQDYLKKACERNKWTSASVS